MFSEKSLKTLIETQKIYTDVAKVGFMIGGAGIAEAEEAVAIIESISKNVFRTLPSDSTLKPKWEKIGKNKEVTLWLIDPESIKIDELIK